MSIIEALKKMNNPDEYILLKVNTIDKKEKDEESKDIKDKENKEDVKPIEGKEDIKPIEIKDKETIENKDKEPMNNKNEKPIEEKIIPKDDNNMNKNEQIENKQPEENIKNEEEKKKR